MLDNFIRGGQIFLHNVAMFKQVLGRSIAASLLMAICISSYLTMNRFNRLDYQAGATYVKASTLQWIYEHRIILHSNASKVIPRLDAFDKNGLYAAAVPALSVINSLKFRAAYQQIKAAILYVLLIACLILTACLSLMFVIWARFGQAAKATRFLQGNKVCTEKETISFLRVNGLASFLRIGNMPLVKDAETKHILITGSTGSGKSNCLHLLLEQIKANNQPSIVVDTEGTMIERYYNSERDIILNPFDVRSHSWDFWQEIATDRLTEKIACSFFPSMPSDSYSGDKRWNSWGRMLFLGAIEYLKSSNNKSIGALFHLLHQEKLEVLMKKLQGTDISGLMESKSDNNPAPHNIRMNAMEATRWLKYFAEARSKSLCLRNWFNSLDQSTNTANSWIFLSCDRQDAEFLLPFISAIMDIALGSLIALPASNKRRVWFVMDELAKLRYMPALEKNITLVRKYGGCILAATQSFKQIFAHYGRLTGSTMLSQFNTNIVFRLLDSDDANIIAKRAGNVELLNQQKNTSYGAHEHRDGISYTEQRRSKPLIEASDLASLETGEAFVLLPEPEVAITKVKAPAASNPKVLQPDFILDPRMEQLKQEQKQEHEMQVNRGSKANSDGENDGKGKEDSEARGGETMNDNKETGEEEKVRSLPDSDLTTCL